MAQKQQAHRHSIETRDQKIFPVLFLFGEIVGLVIAFTIIICSTFLLYNDKDIAGYTTLVTAIAGLVGVFISRNKRIKELEEDN